MTIYNRLRRFGFESDIFPRKTYEGFPDQVIEVISDRMSLPRPHYSDNRFKNVQLMYLSPEADLSLLDWDYSDRFRQWDLAKYTKANEEGLKHHFPSVQFFEVFIDVFYDGNRVLKAVAGGVNHSNGYEYFVLGSEVRNAN